MFSAEAMSAGELCAMTQRATESVLHSKSIHGDSSIGSSDSSKNAAKASSENIDDISHP